jgi:hypothetical protein
MSIGKLTSRYTLHLTMVAQAITSPRDVTRVRHYKPAVTLPSDESMSIGEVAGVSNAVLCYYSCTNYFICFFFSYLSYIND